MTSAVCARVAVHLRLTVLNVVRVIGLGSSRAFGYSLDLFASGPLCLLKRDCIFLRFFPLTRSGLFNNRLKRLQFFVGYLTGRPTLLKEFYVLLKPVRVLGG